MSIFDRLTGLRGCSSGCLGFTLYEARFRYHATLLLAFVTGGPGPDSGRRGQASPSTPETALTTPRIRTERGKPEGAASGEGAEET